MSMTWKLELVHSQPGNQNIAIHRCLIDQPLMVFIQVTRFAFFQYSLYSMPIKNVED